MKVFIARKLPSIAERLLKAKAYDVDVYEQDRAIPKSTLIGRAKDADALISLLTDKIDEEVIDNLSKCKVIANYAVGYNNINVKYANDKGIIVTNTPGILTDSTADLTMALLLSCARRLSESEEFLKDMKYKVWKPELLLGIELKNKVLGIIGAGRIGQATAKRAIAFGMKVIYFNKSKKTRFENETGAKKVSLNYLLKNSNFISVHLPLNDQTYHILNHDNLKLLRENSIILNTSRGEVINERDLIKLLKERNIVAGLDVFENEPNVSKQLLRLKNTLVLPHIGSATIEARTKMAEIAVKNVMNVLQGKKPLTPVN